MRILFILTQDLASPSGLGRFFPMARNLVHCGHDVRVVATHANFDQLKERHLSIEGVSVEYVSQMHVRKMGSHKSYFPLPAFIWNTVSSTFRLSVAALAQPVDLVVIGKPHPMNGIAGLLARIFRKCVLVVDVDDDEAGSGHFQASWQRKIVSWFSVFIPGSANWVMTNTMHTLRNLEKNGIDRNKIFYLPNGVDADRFRKPDLEQVERLKGKYKIQNQKIVLYMGSISLASHAIDLLIDAVEILTRERNDILLLIAGGGEDYVSLHEKVKKIGLQATVIFCGRVEPADVVNYYALADVSVDPVNDDRASRGRNPLKMFESWINGVPFITSNVGDRESIAGNPPAALLVEPGNAQALAQGIQEILDSTVLASTLRNEGHQRVAKFTWQALVVELNLEIEKRFIRKE